MIWITFLLFFTPIDSTFQYQSTIEAFEQHFLQDSTQKMPVMAFESRLIDLGKVKKGELKTFYLKFTNEGNAPLTIEFISSCECTETSHSDESVQPGEKGEIEVIFDSTTKDEAETISIDILLAEIDPRINAPIIETVEYKFEIIK